MYVYNDMTKTRYHKPNHPDIEYASTPRKLLHVKSAVFSCVSSQISHLLRSFTALPCHKCVHLLTLSRICKPFTALLSSYRYILPSHLSVHLPLLLQSMAPMSPFHALPFLNILDNRMTNICKPSLDSVLRLAFLELKDMPLSLTQKCHALPPQPLTAINKTC